MNETAKIIFGLVGGLAMFLFGMNSMSDALQKAAGEKMKKVLSFLTKNPLMGALAGALVTAVLQSSSATTVMVIGFVSAGLMSLPQAVSVIFGANIGTTMTAQLMAFKISNYIYPIIFIGFMLQFLGKKEKIKNIGMVILSFGLLFEGIEIMGSVMKPLANSPIFVDMMVQVKHIPVLGVILGAVMTLVVQSSSATIAVLQNFASQPMPDGVTSVIGLTGAIPILLGDNIGTTITALLASIGQSKNAKRTAVAELRQCIEIAQNLFTEAMDSVINGDDAEAEIVIKNRGKMRKAQKKNTKAHLNRVEKKICDPALTQAYSSILYNLDRVADNCVGIAEETMDGVVFVKLEEEQMEEMKLELEAAAV